MAPAAKKPRGGRARPQRGLNMSGIARCRELLAVSGLWIFASLALLASPVTFAQKEDLCTEFGGKAICVGANIDSYSYTYVSAPWTSPHAFPSESAALAYLENTVKASRKGCTSQVYSPPWQP